MEALEAIGVERAEARLAGIAERFLHPELSFAAVIREFEEGERSIFESYGGKYVKSGSLLASLTHAATGAIREITPGGLRFGSSLPYARFQGTRGVGRHQLPSAILKLTPGEVLAAGKTIFEYVIHGGRL